MIVFSKLDKLLHDKHAIDIAFDSSPHIDEGIQEHKKIKALDEAKWLHPQSRQIST